MLCFQLRLRQHPISVDHHFYACRAPPFHPLLPISQSSTCRLNCQLWPVSSYLSVLTRQLLPATGRHCQSHTGRRCPSFAWLNVETTLSLQYLGSRLKSGNCVLVGLGGRGQHTRLAVTLPSASKPQSKGRESFLRGNWYPVLKRSCVNGPTRA